MKRLVRKANSNEYKFRSPVFVNIGDEESWRASVENLKSNDGFENIIAEQIDRDMAEMGPEGLAQYLDYDYKDLEDGIIESIIVSIENCEAITTVKSTRELSIEELEKVKDYISGQFSDGYGEGLEQQELDEWEESYEEEYEDEETGEFYMEEVEYKATMSASLWSSRGWSIELV